MSKSSIRPIGFGIRLKIILLTAGTSLFVSLVVAFMVYNQHIEALHESAREHSSAILRGAQDEVITFLTTRNLIHETDSPVERQKLLKQYLKERQQVGEFFKKIIPKDEKYDISFVIHNQWRSTDLKGNRNDRPDFFFFKRYSTEVVLFKKFHKVLSPSMYHRVIGEITLKPVLVFLDDPTKKTDYVLVGNTIFKNRHDRYLYERYKKFTSLKTKRELKPKKLKQEEELLRNRFLRKLSAQNRVFTYTVSLPKKDQAGILFAYYWFYHKERGISRRRYHNIRTFFIERFHQSVVNNTISSAKLMNIFSSTTAKYSLHNSDEKRCDNNIHPYLRKYGSVITTPFTTKELALMSYRIDLLGISGMYLHRYLFSKTMKERTWELVNLIVAILIRAVAIAIFFPTFIIRSIQKVAAGAREIGKGNFDVHIEMKGSDEIAQLSDVLNEMAVNLKKASKEHEKTIRMEGELKTAEAIQKALLPETFPQVPSFSFAAHYSAQSEAGGDYYDVIELSDGSLVLVMADVSGHGVGSGLVMAMTRTLLHSYLREEMPLENILSRVNDYLYENTASNYFVSMFLGKVKPSGNMTYVSAGHLPSLIKGEQKLRKLSGGGIALGAVGKETFESLLSRHETTLKDNDVFIQLTDGVVEAMNNAGEEYGEKRFEKAIYSCSEKKLDKIITFLLKDLNSFTRGAEQNDDVTLLLMKYRNEG